MRVVAPRPHAFCMGKLFRGLPVVFCLLMGCGPANSITTMMPPDSGAGGSMVKELDPNIPAICQDDAWPDCPEGVFGFYKNRSGEEWHTDRTTCSVPKVCTVCQYQEPGNEMCNDERREFHGNCKTTARGGTCDSPSDPLGPQYTVYCVDHSAGQNFSDFCAGT